MVDKHTTELLSAAVSASRAGHRDNAARLYHQVLERAGDHPIALNGLGMIALGAQDPAAAARFFERAIVADRQSPDLWMNLAKARREESDHDKERAALLAALALDQRHFMAIVRLAELHERRGESVDAARRWNDVLAAARSMDDQSTGLQALLAHARDYVNRDRTAFATTVDNHLAEARNELDPAARRRVDACIDHALGRRQIYHNDCAGLHFPFLPAEEFFERSLFPWLEKLEQHTAEIRAECEALLAANSGAIRPYVAMEPGTPKNKWSDLDHSLDWSALHLWKDGERNNAACGLASLTASIVEQLPLSDLPGRTPTIFFSILRPGAHLPAHTGVSNVRSIVHLPLIVPSGCTFRVGGTTRDWQEGRAWVFDDTIEHEAWNRSDRIRAILIFDVWNPYITSVERDLLRRFFSIAGAASGTASRALEVSD